MHVGTGRARRFRPEQAYLAAVLLRLADWGLSIGSLKAVADIIKSENARGSDMMALWAEAQRRPAGPDPVFAGLAIQLDDAGDLPVSVGIRIQHGSRLNTPPFYLDRWDSILVLNLTAIFADVQLV
jgi:hypothetical protein